MVYLSKMGMGILDLNYVTTTLLRRTNVTKEFILWAIEYERERRKKEEAPFGKIGHMHPL